LAETDGQYDRGDADEDAQRRERGPEPVRADRVPGVAQDVGPGHRTPPCAPARAPGPPRPSEAISPSRMRMMRAARLATSASWVINTTVRPCSCSSLNSCSTSSV